MYYISYDYAYDNYDSCKNVLNPATSGLAMDFLCGPWGAKDCNPQKWLDYMGSTANGYSPFDILYTISNAQGSTGDNSFFK